MVDHAINENEASQKNKDISLSLYTKLKCSDLSPRFLRRSEIDGDWFEVSEKIAVRTIYNMVSAMKNRATIDAATPVDMTTRTTTTRYMSAIRPIDALPTTLDSSVTPVMQQLLYLSPSRQRRELWTNEEHLIMLDGFIKYGDDPRTISTLLKNRTESMVHTYLKIKKNYNRLLRERNEKISRDETLVAAPLIVNTEQEYKLSKAYTQEEKEIILDGYIRYGRDNVAISKLLNNRDEESIERFLKRHRVWLRVQKRKRNEEENDSETLVGDMLSVSKKVKYTNELYRFFW